MVGDIKQIVH